MTRRTIRRYAHELYPHPDEGEIRPLSVEVPYLYARMVGLAVSGTGWTKAPTEEIGYRLEALTEAARTALLADALAQKLTGDDAWEWVTSYLAVDDGLECAYDRAVAHGVDPLAIKPYPCGPTPDRHWHRAKVGGLWSSVRVSGAEGACEQCTESVEDQPDETATEETA
jgi:hypothetical protein